MNNPARPSCDMAHRYLDQVKNAIQDARQGKQVSANAIVWPPGLDRTILHRLPISTRTRDCLNAAKLIHGSAPLRAMDLLQLEDFERTALADFLVNLERFLVDCVQEKESLSIDRPYPTERYLEAGISCIGAEPHVESEPSTWLYVGTLLGPLLATSAQLRGTQSVAEVLHPDILRLATHMNQSNELHALGIYDIVDPEQSLPMVVSSRISNIINGGSDREQLIVRLRLARSPPETLDAVGVQLGVTRERVRQIQLRIEKKINTAVNKDISIIAGMLEEILDPIVPDTTMTQVLRRVLPGHSVLADMLFRKKLIELMQYSRQGKTYFDRKAVELLGRLRKRAQDFADDVGLLNTQQLIDQLPSDEWRQYWPIIRTQLELHEIQGMLAIRDSTKARVKAALLSIGRPATRKEIAFAGDLPDDGVVGPTLSNVPSVVRATKERWGLREWVDDEYEGIVGEIIQRIEEDGGSTTVERILKELPKKFNVSAASVRSYMHTSRFAIQDGWISVANASTVRLRNLDDVIHGRDSDGAPYWTFIVNGRYLEGFSVTGVPPEIAREAGCEPDSKTEVRITNLEHCRNLSLHWRLASPNGASLGYIADPLRKIGLGPGDRARITIQGTGVVALSAHQENIEMQLSGGAEEALKRILRRRRSL